MGAGAFASALLHGSVIALTLIAWPRLLPDTLPPEVIPVEVLPIAQETNIMAQTKAEKPIEEPKPEPPPPAPQAAEPPPPPPPEPEQLAMPDPTIPPIPKEPEAKPQPATPRFAHLQPQRKPKPEKPDKFDINKIDALVNRIPDKPKPEAPPAAPTTAQSTRTIKGVGAQTAMTMSELDALRQQMTKCWNFDPGSPDPAALVLRVKVFLNQDGSVAGAPQLIDTMKMGDPYFRVAAEAALRAVKMCQPYKLPADKYDTWKEIDVTFDPRAMSGG